MKTITKFFAATLLLLSLAISAFAYDFSAVCSSGQTLYYTITSSTSPYTVKVAPQNPSSPYYSISPTGDLIIPSSVTYNSITYSVTSIGYQAFCNCIGLTEVTIGNSVTSIGYQAFCNCSGLTSVTIPNSVTSIGNSAFNGCYSLTAVNFNATNCAAMGNSSYPVFSNCNDNATINIGEGVATIPNYAFMGLKGSGTLTIPNSVTGIGSYAFSGCSGFSEIIIGENVTNISTYAFSGCSGLTSITIPESITSIGGKAFNACSGLTTVNYNAINCTTMGSSSNPVFNGCTSLATLNIGENVTNIPGSAFYGCSGLTIVNYNATNCTTMGGSINPVFNGCTSLATLNIGENVTNIPNYAFCNCSGLTSVTIGNSVASIGNSAFSGCSGLTGTLTIPNSVTSIGSSAFSGCSGLTSVTIGTSVTSIGNYSFQNCSGLTSVTIPNSVTSIGVGSFSGCSGLTSVTIPNSVTSIGYSAFEGCVGLISVTIPNSVTSIGVGSFSGCSGLTIVNFNATNCTTMGSSSSPVFNNCTSLSTLNIGENVTNIPSYAFSGCSGLTSVTIPNSVTSIGYSAFSGCSGLTTVNFNATNCTTMGSISSPVFNNCTSLSTLNIGENVTNIPSYAFSSCSGLTDIYANPITPPTVGGNAFWPVSATLWVPCGTATAYSAADGWSNFSDIRENGASLLSVSSANLQMGTASITLQPSCSNGNARIVATPNEGYRFVQWNDGNTDNPRSLYVSSPVEYVASFEAIPTYTITAVSADEATGTVTGGGIFYEGETATLTATAAEGYRFATWNDGNTDNPRTVTVTEDATYTATFAVFHTITVTTADETQGTASGSGDYAEGSQVEISAIPAEHHHFTQWNDGNTDNPRTITVTSDSTFTASFAIDRFTITVESNDEAMGTVSDGGTYDYGTEIQISATPAEGYGFAAWNDGNTDNPRTITVTEDATYTATFAVFHRITVTSADETQGTASGNGDYPEGSQVEISATPSEHYHFAQWSDGNTDNPRTITVTGDATYIATFAPNNYTIVVRSINEETGTVSGGGTFPYGTEIQISATPAENYAFVAWTDGNTDNPRTITVVADAEYTAAFTWSVGIDETAVSEIALFPNPANDILNISSSETISEIEIVNVMGQVVKRIEVNADSVACDVEELKAGVYVVRIRTASATLSQQRFIKE